MITLAAQQAPAGQSELNATTEAMGRGHNHEEHQHMAAHMHMTELRPVHAGDAAKAQQVVEQARPALEKYRDYKVALAEGFRIFLPNVPQKMYHFTNYENAIGEAFRFDPAKPTSLLYEKHGDDYKLIGAMYTAPVRFSEQQLDERIPLSMTQWHQHVNMCKPPKGREVEALAQGRQIRTERLHLNRRSLRSRRRHVHASRLWLDGAHVSVGENAGRNLVSRAPAQRQAGTRA